MLSGAFGAAAAAPYRGRAALPRSLPFDLPDSLEAFHRITLCDEKSARSMRLNELLVFTARNGKAYFYE